jgi:hypothetical protein
VASKEWLAEIGSAADDLGYGIVSISLQSVVLTPLRGKYPESIRIDSVMLGGKQLRMFLRPLPKDGTNAVRQRRSAKTEV